MRPARDATAAQAQLTRPRRYLERYPGIPALKAIVREQTGEELWRNLRPPLDALDDATTRRVARRALMHRNPCLFVNGHLFG